MQSYVSVRWAVIVLPETVPVQAGIAVTVQPLPESPTRGSSLKRNVRLPLVSPRPSLMERTPPRPEPLPPSPWSHGAAGVLRP